MTRWRPPREAGQGVTAPGRLVGLASEVRELDRQAIEDWGLAGAVLMETAGARTATLIGQRTGWRPGKAVVLAGRGNNGGDGYVIARHLRTAGWKVVVVAPAGLPERPGDARTNAMVWQRDAGEVVSLASKVTARVRHHLGHARCVVDALFGTGLSRPLEGTAASLVEMANQTREGLKVAVDIPSGLHADTGRLRVADGQLAPCFSADLTATYIAPKAGLWLGGGVAVSGEVVTVPLGLPRQVIEASAACGVRLMDRDTAKAWMPNRPVRSHKGLFGHVAVLGGRRGMEGAGRLACRGALRAGAGLVTWCTDAEVANRQAEVMASDLQMLAPRASVWVAGCGLGADQQSIPPLEFVAQSALPQVWDADALNLVASGQAPTPPETAVITPHPAEAARLLGWSTADVLGDGLKALAALVDRFRVTVLLKGAVTLVGSPATPPILVRSGDPTLSVGGSGDVLAGVIGGLLGQGLPPVRAAALAAFIHGRSAVSLGQRQAQRGVLASEVADQIPRQLQELSC